MTRIICVLLVATILVQTFSKIVQLSFTRLLNYTIGASLLNGGTLKQLNSTSCFWRNSARKRNKIHCLAISCQPATTQHALKPLDSRVVAGCDRSILIDWCRCYVPAQSCTRVDPTRGSGRVGSSSMNDKIYCKILRCLSYCTL